MTPATQTEFMLMVDFQGAGGVFGTEQRRLGAVREEYALDAARKALKHAGRVEVFTREVPVEWVKVEELRP